MKTEVKVLWIVFGALLQQVCLARSLTANKHEILLRPFLQTDAVADTDVDADVDAVSLTDADTDDGDEPDLQSMLNYFKGGSDIQKLISFLHEYESAKNVLKDMIALSPLFHQIMTQASEKSAKLRILYKVIEGKAPDIKDMYELVTNKDSDSITTTLVRVALKNKSYRRFIQLVLDPDLLKSNAKIMEISELVVGQKFSVSENVMNLVRGGGYPSEIANPIELNCLELIFFLDQNYNIIAFNILPVFDPNEDHLQPLEKLLSMNTSHLEQITWVPNSKYTVTHGKDKTDPDVAAILLDIQNGKNLDKTDPEAKAKATHITTDLALRILSLIEGLLKSYKTLTNGQGNSVSAPGMG